MHKYIHTKYEGRMAGLREREDKDRQKTVVIPCFEKLDGTWGSTRVHTKKCVLIFSTYLYNHMIYLSKNQVIIKRIIIIFIQRSMPDTFTNALPLILGGAP